MYDFWGSKLARQLAAETDFVLNLASKEYSRAVAPHLPSPVVFLTCAFGERKGGKLVEKGTHCMACICRCPTQAVEYGKRSQGKPQYQCGGYTGE